MYIFAVPFGNETGFKSSLTILREINEVKEVKEMISLINEFFRLEGYNFIGKTRQVVKLEIV